MCSFIARFARIAGFIFVCAYSPSKDAKAADGLSAQENSSATWHDESARYD
jgi:hypothetical protein